VSDADRGSWTLEWGARAGAGLVMLLGHTWRLEYAPGYHEQDRDLFHDRQCIFAFWHARMFPLVFTHRHRGAAVLISQHRDGEWIARIVSRMGYVTARGSSTRGGEAALLDLLDYAARGTPIAITPDGPRGPAERVKPGLVYLASRSGLPIVPVAAVAQSSWVMRSWDRFRIPKPLTRVRLAYGTPIVIPPDLDEGSLEARRVEVEQALAGLTRTTAAEVGERT
jgi:lysophospholipid acyltransferase (LPLAT)-like uncharacterized protein